MTSSVSRPASALAIASSWPGRSVAKPKASRATRSIRESPTASRLPEMASERPWSGRRLHFVGIGGAGMSGLALVAHGLGASVTGSDRAAGSPYAGPLRAAGITPVVGHDAANVPAGAQVVYSSAIPPDNPERRSRCMPPPYLLGELTRLKRTLAVTG